MIRKSWMTGAVCLVLSGMVASSMAAPKEGEKSERPARKNAFVMLGLQTYTWHKLTFFECVDKAKEAGIKYVEGFAWQKIAPDIDAKLDPSASPEVLDKVEAKLKEAGIHLMNLYVADFGKDAESQKKYFEFARRMKIKVFVAEPDAKLLEALEPLCEEYRVKLAIHNHPKGDENYKNWNPDNVMKLIDKHGKTIGVCADTGHWIRAGLDPVEGLKKYEGRIVTLHLKDVNEKGAKGEDVPFGTGVGNVKGQLEELARQKFVGVASIEYESPKPEIMEDVKKCVEYFSKTAPEVGIKVVAR